MQDVDVVLVPGLGLGPEAWAPTATRLERSWTVLTLPGFGRPARGADLRPLALAEQVLETLGDGPPVVLGGHSASCQIVAHVATLAPERVRGLLLAGPTTDPRAASWPGLVLRWLRTAGHETPRQLPSLVRQYARTTLWSAGRAMEQARHDRIDKTLADGDVEVLVVRGRNDRICPQDWAARVASRPMAGAVETLPVGGHMVPLTHGPLVAPLLEGFARRVLDA